MLVNLVMMVRLWHSRYIPRLDLTRYSHLKDRFPGIAAQQDDLSSMFNRDATS